jgi:predicted dehydrogenase
MTRLIHTGIIGFGLSGKVFHAPFIHTHPGFHLASIVERNHQHSKEIYPYVSVVSDYQQLLNDESLELLVIATPNKYHFPMAKEGMLAGKHVVIEKPFTTTSHEADELISISEECGRKIFVYHNRRWDGDFLTVRKLLGQDILGNIVHFEAHFDRFSPDIKPDAWRNENIPGGGNLFDLGSHLIDQAMVLFGKPEAVRAEIKAERPESPVDDFFELELFYPEQSVLLKAGMLVKNPGPRYFVQGADAIFTKYGLDPQEESLKAGEMPDLEHWGADRPELFGKIELNNNSDEKLKAVQTENGNYMGFYDNVYEVLLRNKPMEVKPQQARDVIFIIEKAFESSVNNSVIRLNSMQ